VAREEESSRQSQRSRKQPEMYKAGPATGRKEALKANLAPALKESPAPRRGKKNPEKVAESGRSPLVVTNPVAAKKPKLAGLSPNSNSQLSPLQQALAASLADTGPELKEPASLGYSLFLGTFRKQFRKDHVGLQYVEKEMRRAAVTQWHAMEPSVRVLMGFEDSGGSRRGASSRASPLLASAAPASGTTTPVTCPGCNKSFTDAFQLQWHQGFCKSPAPAHPPGKKPARKKRAAAEAAGGPKKAARGVSSTSRAPRSKWHGANVD